MSNDDLRLRVAEAKKKLPKHGLSNVFFHLFSDEYDKEDKSIRNKVRNVLNLVAVDVDITHKIEKMVLILSTDNS